MKKILIIIGVYFSSLVAMQDGDKANQIIEANLHEFLKIVKPGLESAIAGSVVQSKIIADLKTPVNFVTISKCSKCVIAKSFMSTNNMVQMWDLRDFNNPTEVNFLKETKVKFAAISANGKYIITKNLNVRKIWCVKSPDNIASEQLKLPKDFADPLAISDCGNFVITGTDSNLLSVWDIRDTGNIKQIILHGHKKLIYAVTISKCSKYIITGSNDKSIIIWDISDFNNVRQLKKINCPDTINSLAISSDNKYLIAAHNNSVLIWVIRNGFIHEKSEIQLIETIEHSKMVNSVAISNCGKFLIVGSSNKAHIYDIREPNKLKLLELNGHASVVMSVAISPCCKYVATGSGDKTVRIWDVSGWVINSLSLSQLEILEKLVSCHTETVIKYYQDNKNNFTDNMQYYIERYLRNKLIEYYLSANTENSGTDLQNIISSYLEIQGALRPTQKTKTSTRINSQLPCCTQDDAKSCPANCRDSQHSKLSKICAACSKTDANLRCAGCKKVFYCSRICQKTNWKSHKLICKT